MLYPAGGRRHVFGRMVPWFGELYSGDFLAGSRGFSDGKILAFGEMEGCCFAFCCRGRGLHSAPICFDILVALVCVPTRSVYRNAEYSSGVEKNRTVGGGILAHLPLSFHVSCSVDGK